MTNSLLISSIKQSRKASVASVNGARGSGGTLTPQWVFQGAQSSKKGSKEHLDWPKIDLNAAEIITAQDINVNGSAYVKCSS